MTTESALSYFPADLTATTWSTAWVQEDAVWLLVVGFVAAFVLAFSVGANDVANSFGTTVGAKVLTLRQACILATIFETSGAVLIGAKVGEMIRKGIIDVEIYQTEGGARLLMMGEVAAMFGSAVWQLIATVLKVPVSGTHSIVGACIGFSLVAAGSTGVNWSNLGFIVASWFISPALSGVMSVLMYFLILKFILRSDTPFTNGLRMLPLFYAFTVGINTFSILYAGAPLLGFKDLPSWGAAIIAIGVMVMVVVITHCYTVPKLKRQEENTALEEKCETEKENFVVAKRSSCSSSSSLNKPMSSDDPGIREVQFESDAETKSNEYRKDSLAKISVGNETETPKFVRFDESVLSSSAESSVADLHQDTTFTVKLMTSDTSIDQCDVTDGRLAKRQFNKKCSSSTSTVESKKSNQENDDDEETPTIHRLFSSLQILTACFASFAHGGNDVSNAIGPLIAIWMIFWSGEVGQKAFTPWYLLLYGGFGISIGLWLFGRRVMETIGKDLTKITSSRGFCIELMTAFTVLCASNLGIPISTTHCKVGAVVSIGWYRSRSAVQWSMVRNIALAWFVTLPVSGLLSALTMFVLMQF